MRNLILVLGDQLDRDSAVFDGFDKQSDAVWMAENHDENTHAWCHKQRILFFLSAMRHFRDDLRRRGIEVHYHELTEDPGADRGTSFAAILTADVQRLKPTRLIVVQPGDYRVLQELTATAESLGMPLEIREDRHFYCSIDEFAQYADKRSGLILEFFYRHLRKQHSILMESENEPVGGQWNFDHDNRESFKKHGPPPTPTPLKFRRSRNTKETADLVATRFAQHPGRLDTFNLPVTRKQAVSMLEHFVELVLPNFGRFQDAMWTDHDFLFHSRLSAALNVKLLSPRECVDAAIAAYEAGLAPLNSVEGFVRQILGWREYVRGIYWLKMPEYLDLNHLEHNEPIPSFFWDGETDMNCVRDAMRNVIENGYAHHIQRLMILGNFAQLWGVDPRLFHEWHMAMYTDAIDWVSAPNTIGMSQFGDGGIVGTKPYCSSGNYINKMSNYCKGCRYSYKERTSDKACPFTTLYWEFMDRHFDRLKGNGRLKFAIKNLEKIREKPNEMAAIRARATELRESGRL